MESPRTLRASHAAPGPEQEAARLVAVVRAALESERHDDATAAAEQLLELLVYGSEPGVLRIAAPAVALLDSAFAARVGSLDSVVRPVPHVSPRKLNLSARASSLLASVERPMTVRSVVDGAGIPRRDAIRLLAGLLRRGALAI